MKVNLLLVGWLLAMCLAVPAVTQTSKRKSKPGRKVPSVKPAAPVKPLSEEERQAAENGRIAAAELKRKLEAKEPLVIIDTRDGRSWIGSAVKIPGAIHITLSELDERMNDLPKDKEIITYCT